MAERKQKSQLAELLDEVEKAHKSEIRLYVSGHLNHNKLFKPPKSTKYNYWESAKRTTLRSAKKDALEGSHEVLEKGSSSKDVPPVPVRAKSASPLGYPSPIHPASFRTPVSVSLSTAAFKLQKKEAPEKPQDEAGIFQKQLIREELDIPEMKLLKYRRLKNSRLCVTKEFKDEYRFLPSYLAGVTKKDQYNKFMQVQKEYIAKQDLLENDFIGSKSTERHEKKLAQALQNICDCRGPHFYRLQAIGQVFEDICNSSLIFGDILKEVKNEYELYMVILLDSLPATQYRTLQEQVKGLKKRMVMTHEIEESRQTIQDLVQKSKLALARNEELRNKLEIELWVSQTGRTATKKEEGDRAGEKETSVASAELLTSLRCQIIMKWEEIQAIEKEIKNTMTFSGIINAKQKTVKELEAEASKLEASNKFLNIQIRDAEHSIRAALRRQKFNEANQRCLWELVRDFLQPLGEDILETSFGLFSQTSFHL
ncbi:uncharacterized protein C6orf118 homolog [Protobothrops mucrosquamatus]|uniref:uncharacterized protein C6orf118 homolog n=1 Tax=Protobothrops mucrosquamatus TaxID=103944 RepID=UPI00077596C5|nr:uncharacterized protein C6orf118 homolog [Protobothrops mucrosquamatus]XP_015673570.1 uncharacterized protein C6orf118 homolog [Protobothrops mucrosquamatus]